MTPKNTSWGAVAGWYDEMLEDHDSYQRQVLMPNLIRVVDPHKGMTIVDIACGQGYFSRAFAEKKAKVIGCDISKELIDIAKNNSPKEIEYFVSASDALSFMGIRRDAANIEAANNASDKNLADKNNPDLADAAVIVLALQNIENLDGTFAECSRVLKPDGRLIIVLNHPAFRIPKNSSWQWDEKARKQYRRIDSYMSEQRSEIDMNPGENDAAKKKFTMSFHRPLQSYFKALAKAGFAVTRFEEWISHKKSQSGPRAAEEDRLRKEIPMFVCIEGRRD